MPNLYATPDELKQAVPDGFQSTTTDYDTILYRLLDRISREIDKHCGRVFYPRSDTRYYNGSGTPLLDIDDMLEVSNVYISDDDGSTYTELTTSDYISIRGGHLNPYSPYSSIGAEYDFNHPGSYGSLLIDENGDYSEWSEGQKSIKIVGIFAYADNRDDAWEDSQDEVENDPLGTTGTSLTVNDVDGADLWGQTPRICAGHLLKIESEFVEATATDTGSQTANIVRGRNGTTAASHAQNKTIYVWRTPADVRQAAIIQATKMYQRGQQSFADSRATAEIGELLYIKSLDADSIALLKPYRRASKGFA